MRRRSTRLRFVPKTFGTPDTGCLVLLRIATRGSALALIQTNWVAARLRAAHPGLVVETVVLRTRGDAILDQPIPAMGGKGIFVKELEEALLDRRADLAVHSLKDMPADLPPGLAILATPARADPRDALVLPRHAPPAPHAGLLPLAEGARVGCSSLRRCAQLLAARPDLHPQDVRGNVDTRLRKLDAGEYDALVLAAAGLIRLGEAGRIHLHLPLELCLPAPGQGILAIEARADDPEIQRFLQPIHDPIVYACATAERAVLQTLDAGCNVPLAALATLEDDHLRVQARLLTPDGSRAILALEAGPPGQAAALGRRVGEHLLGQGGDALLRQIRGDGAPL
ncbi:MAG: hydroxymethylbilane synthase [Armatimonadetes bacterium]|nr:hydroxymethylbilane synthase [Armatimonadota bacterium]